MRDILDKLKFNQDGLIAVITQDYNNNQVLMQAWMNKESIEKTIESGFATYFSRSRQKLWKKGETSGHLQELKEFIVDCDYDSILLKVKQTGPACHTGAPNCFFHKVI